MKTGVTVYETMPISQYEARDVQRTKIFDDTATIADIKDWIIKTMKLKITRDKLGLSGYDITDIEED